MNTCQGNTILTQKITWSAIISNLKALVVIFHLNL